MVLEVNRDSKQSADSAPCGAHGSRDPGEERTDVTDPPHRSRRAHVDSLREMLAAGTYEVPAEVLADSILKVAIRGRRTCALDGARLLTRWEHTP